MKKNNDNDNTFLTAWHFFQAQFYAAVHLYSLGIRIKASKLLIETNLKRNG